MRPTGVCGATAETIAARNFARMVAGGAAAHSDHARGVAELFLATAKGEVADFEIKDEQKLYQLAMDFGVEIGNRDLDSSICLKCLRFLSFLQIPFGQLAESKFGFRNPAITSLTL